MTFLKEKLCASQKQAVIKLIEKKDREKRFIKNWRPMSLLNVDVKLTSKVLSNRIKNLLPNLISNNQNAYVANRFIREGGRLISDNLEMRNILNMEDYLLTKDIEKAFDFVDHCFLLAILEKYGLRNIFYDGLKLCWTIRSLNERITTHYFKLSKETRQDDTIYVYLFILVLEAVFCVIKPNKNIEGWKIFNHEFLYIAYADDFFLKGKISVFETLNIFHKFSLVPGLSPNITTCEIAGIGTLEGVTVELCGIKRLNLTKETVKIIGVHFSYSQKLEHETNFQSHIVEIESVLRLWRMKNLTIEGKVLVFKSLATSKIVHQSLVTTVPHAKLINSTIYKKTLYGTEKI